MGHTFISSEQMIKLKTYMQNTLKNLQNPSVSFRAGVLPHKKITFYRIIFLNNSTLLKEVQVQGSTDLHIKALARVSVPIFRMVS